MEESVADTPPGIVFASTRGELARRNFLRFLGRQPRGYVAMQVYGVPRRIYEVTLPEWDRFRNEKKARPVPWYRNVTRACPASLVDLRPEEFRWWSRIG
jgi:hypothetical protein